MTLEEWLGLAVPSSAPDGVVAYNFSLAECGDWLVEIVGASTYTPGDSDWACPPEQWTSRPLQLVLARDVAGSTWEQAQAFVIDGVSRFMQAPHLPQAKVLRAARAVCAGFVDGDLVEVGQSFG